MTGFVDFKRKPLLYSVVVTLALLLLAERVAPAALLGWPELIAAALVALILSHTFTVVWAAKPGIRFIRYGLLALLLLSVAWYVPLAKNRLCNDVVTGTLLRDEFSNDRTVEMNKSGNRCDIFVYVAESDPQRIWADVNDSRLKLRFSYLAVLVLLVAFFTHLMEEILLGKTKQASDQWTIGEGVFISYNHNDQATALLLEQELRKNNIATIIEMESMPAGYEIEKFIRESVQQSRITLSLVSEESILSGWVATETLTTFFLQDFNTQKKFIACYLDASFLSEEFTERAYAVINKKLDDINTKIEESNRQKQNRRDLDALKNRLYKLRENLDEIIRRLRDSKCVDIRAEKLPESLPRLVNEIKAVLSATT